MPNAISEKEIAARGWSKNPILLLDDYFWNLALLLNKK